MINAISTNLITNRMHHSAVNADKNQPAQKSVPVPNDSENVLNKYLNNIALINTWHLEEIGKRDLTKPLEELTEVQRLELEKQHEKLANYKNNFKSELQNGEAKILAIVPRSFSAEDYNGNDYIEEGEEIGTFLKGIKRLDDIKAAGFNTLHILPIHPPGRLKAMGTAGSIYAPKDMLEIDPNLIEPDDPRTAEEQFKAFIDACHERGIRVMLDLPSCASYEMFVNRPELMAMEEDGLAKTPQGWNDIRMFQPWEDEGRRILNPDLVDMHKKYIDMCVNLGIDGIRADVARAKPVEFWDIIIPYSHSKDPQFGWLAESYTYEDASPQANMMHDRPRDLLHAGFDSYYGQYHLFPEWATATEFIDYIKENLNMSYEMPERKSLIGSFASHDDISPMFNGGSLYCNLISGLQAVLPMTNPYYIDGYQTGDYYLYRYEDMFNPLVTDTDSAEMTVHRGRLDIFNKSKRPGGNHPEIDTFLRETFKLRDKYKDLILNGSFIELNKWGDKNDQIVTFARHKDGKTLLVVVNKNVNREAVGVIQVPTLKRGQELNNLLPSYGRESILQPLDNELRVDIAPGRIHVFEIDTPEIEQYSNKVYKQKM